MRGPSRYIHRDLSCERQVRSFLKSSVVKIYKAIFSLPWATLCEYDKSATAGSVVSAAVDLCTREGGSARVRDGYNVVLNDHTWSSVEDCHWE